MSITRGSPDIHVTSLLPHSIPHWVPYTSILFSFSALLQFLKFFPGVLKNFNSMRMKISYTFTCSLNRPCCERNLALAWSFCFPDSRKLTHQVMGAFLLQIAYHWAVGGEVISLSLFLKLFSIPTIDCLAIISIYTSNPPPPQFLAVLYGMWDLSSLPRNRTHIPLLEAQSLNPWTTREVLRCLFLIPSCRIHTLLPFSALWPSPAFSSYLLQFYSWLILATYSTLKIFC